MSVNSARSTAAVASGTGVDDGIRRVEAARNPVNSGVAAARVATCAKAARRLRAPARAS